MNLTNNSMLRRTFVSTLAALPLLSGPRPESARITRIRIAQARGKFAKFVAMNAYDKEPKGETYEHPLIRIETNRPGIEGIGAGLYSKFDETFYASIKPLIGADPLELFTMQNGIVTGPSPKLRPLLNEYSFLDAPLLDLAGKLMDKPVWQILGKRNKQEIEAYDGTLYFADVVRPQRGVQAVSDECKESVDAGYKGVKLKLGRNFKWMLGEPGRVRDIEVVHAVRKTVGNKILVMVDPNNGYEGDFDSAWHLMESTADDHLYWMEELFKEDVAKYTELRSKMKAAKMKTLYADGENFKEPSQFEPYLKPKKLVDVLQLDIRRGGFLGNREAAKMAAEVGSISIPHNWASQIGVFMALHLAKVTKAMPMVEDDRSKMDVLVASGYKFDGGSYTVSNEPGLGIQINPKIYRAQCEASERIVSLNLAGEVLDSLT